MLQGADDADTIAEQYTPRRQSRPIYEARRMPPACRDRRWPCLHFCAIAPIFFTPRCHLRRSSPAGRRRCACLGGIRRRARMPPACPATRAPCRRGNRLSGDDIAHDDTPPGTFTIYASNLYFHYQYRAPITLQRAATPAISSIHFYPLLI